MEITLASLVGTLKPTNIILTTTNNKNNYLFKIDQESHVGLNSIKDQKLNKSLNIQNKDTQFLVNIKKLIKKE